MNVEEKRKAEQLRSQRRMHDSSHEQDARGGMRKDKKSKAEKKQVTSQKPMSNEGPTILESEKEAIFRMWGGK